MAAREIISSLGRWRVHAPSVTDVLGAIDLQRWHDVSFWDAMNLLSAWKLGCDTVWSEDRQAGRVYDGVRVKSPFVR